MNQVWVFVLCVVGTLAFWVGLVFHRFHSQRRNSRRFKVIFDDFIQGNNQHVFVDVSLPLPHDDRALRDLYLKCQHGLHDRAYTVALQLSRTHPSVEVCALLLRLGLILNRYEHLDTAINQAGSLDGLERISFANLVCSGRWKEAASFYKSRILERHGSKIEWRLLHLCASAFAQVPVDKAGMSDYEMDLLSLLSGKHTMLEEDYRSVSHYLSTGVCYLDELRFLENRKLFQRGDESNADKAHPTSGDVVRGDWIGAEYEDFRQDFGVDGPHRAFSKAHALRVEKWLQSQRGYRCTYCDEVRRGFGPICNHCLRLEFGQPTRISPTASVPLALAVRGIDIASVERIHWLALLHAT